MQVTEVMPHTEPSTAESAATFSAAATPICGLPWSSASITSIFLPSTPPLAFHSSAASLTALATSWPCLASGPVSGAPAAILIAFCACPEPASIAKAVAAATVQMAIRRMFVLPVFEPAT